MRPAGKATVSDKVPDFVGHVAGEQFDAVHLLAITQESEAMAKLVAIHKMPEDPDRYRAYYDETHLPLALALPGLRKYELSQGVVTSQAGLLKVLFIATLHFDDVASVQAALESPEGRAAMEDVPKFASDTNVEILMFEDVVL